CRSLSADALQSRRQLQSRQYYRPHAAQQLEHQPHTVLAIIRYEDALPPRQGPFRYPHAMPRSQLRRNQMHMPVLLTQPLTDPRDHGIGNTRGLVAETHQTCLAAGGTYRCQRLKFRIRSHEHVARKKRFHTAPDATRRAQGTTELGIETLVALTPQMLPGHSLGARFGMNGKPGQQAMHHSCVQRLNARLVALGKQRNRAPPRCTPASPQTIVRVCYRPCRILSTLNEYLS